MEKYICQFQIPVYYVLLGEIEETGENIFYEGEGLFLSKIMLFFEFGL